MIEAVYFFLGLLLGGVATTLHLQKGFKKKLRRSIVTSQSVIRGKMIEQIAPLISDIKIDWTNARFIGSPVDYIVFEDDIIRFIDVKSGKSSLSARERKIKKQIEENRVSFEVMRVERG